MGYFEIISLKKRFPYTQIRIAVIGRKNLKIKLLKRRNGGHRNEVYFLKLLFFF